MWTHFWDMNSGGGKKEEWQHIFIEAPADEARVIFYNRFGHNPERVTCTCCGEDYSISEHETIELATAYHRGCKFDKATQRYVEEPDRERTWSRYMTVAEFLNGGDAIAIRADEIKPEDRKGAVPEQGYVWK